MSDVQGDVSQLIYRKSDEMRPHFKEVKQFV